MLDKTRRLNVSMTPAFEARMDELQQRLHLPSRSELIRHAIMALEKIEKTVPADAAVRAQAARDRAATKKQAALVD
jgi:Arc/MetJ-type ribon-helix-helix transcriptional regulator